MAPPNANSRRTRHINTRICRNVREVSEDLRDKLTQVESIIHPMGIRLLWAHPQFDRSELMLRTNVPPDFPDGIDETRLPQMLDQPHVFTPVAHLMRQSGGWQTFHDF